MPDLSGRSASWSYGGTDTPASALQFGSTTPRIHHSQGLFRVSVRWSTRTLNPNVNPNPDPNPSLNPKPYP